MSERDPATLRSYRWYGPDSLRAFGHRSRARQSGLGDGDFYGKPVIGILNTWTDLNSCHLHFKSTVESIKRGVLQGGGLPMEIPVMSCGETLTKPTSMIYRNFLAMEAEEMIRANPVDCAVLLGGCDKSTPALIMGAISAGVPAIYVPSGPMIKGNWRGQVLGSGSDVWGYWDERRAGNLSEEEWKEIEGGIARSPGHCMTMGTASTMTAMAEVLGFSIPGASSVPAMDSNHQRLAAEAGRLAVNNAWDGPKPSDLATRKSFENAIAVDMAIGGSTNAIVHLLAMAGRAGVELSLSDFDEISRKTPLITDLRPSGKFLMEDFYFAGGLPAVLKRMESILHMDLPTVNGKTLAENVVNSQVHNNEVIRTIDDPIAPDGGTTVLGGNLAPNGAVIKHSAADPSLLKHSGPAIVFDNYKELSERIDDPDLPVTKDSVLVLRNAGPIGAPGMPEWGMLPIPKKLLKEGVRDMVRVSDARMSGTSYGTCVLHVAPESAAGGPLAAVQDGDMITLDVESRTINLELTDEEIKKRFEGLSNRKDPYARGYTRLYLDHVTQADKGCDFDFLEGKDETPEPQIF
ncbi:L-arabinonate dehydratase [Verrucomicrobia bacterium]|nr:L-arabinonate dehydratase [Verrucomicrobiota bacterium]OUU85959.1 MAG: dihydroxy-acid dehydratase [Verrucomicrobiaceae bacterium TMED76]